MPIRCRSSATYLEQPRLCVALGPDPAHNEMRGQARGLIAIGDFATGVIAIGGISRGLIATGALLLSGLAGGYIAAGGLAVGYYALGGAAFGKFVWSGIHRDPQAVEFFSRLCHSCLTPRGPKPLK